MPGIRCYPSLGKGTGTYESVTVLGEQSGGTLVGLQTGKDVSGDFTREQMQQLATRAPTLLGCCSSSFTHRRDSRQEHRVRQESAQDDRIRNVAVS